MDDTNKQQAAVKALRDALQKPMKVPIAQLQKATARDPGIKEPIWLSRVNVPAPETLVLRDIFFDALLDADDRIERSLLNGINYMPHFKAEWTGIRSDGKVDKASELSEQQKYDNLLREQKSHLTILYVQGGSMVTGNASTGRRNITEICRTTGAKAFALDYRLAPQEVFPRSLLDVLVTYFYLIAPPSGAYHSPVPPSSIVLAAESAGSALCLGLIQFLLYLQRNSSSPLVKELCKGQTPADLMPAGCAFLSLAADLSGGLQQSITENNIDWMVGGPHWERDYYPADKFWPTNPPRSSLMVEGAFCIHPMLGAVGCKNWKGAPPIWMANGDESSVNGAKVCAQRLVHDGVAVRYIRYEGMPHIFPMLLPKLPQSKHVMKEWGQACRQIYEGSASWLEAKGDETEVVTVHLGKLEQTSSKIATLTNITFEQATEKLNEARKRQMDPKNAWTGPKVTKSSL